MFWGRFTGVEIICLITWYALPYLKITDSEFYDHLEAFHYAIKTIWKMAGSFPNFSIYCEKLLLVSNDTIFFYSSMVSGDYKK